MKSSRGRHHQMVARPAACRPATRLRCCCGKRPGHVLAHERRRIVSSLRKAPRRYLRRNRRCRDPPRDCATIARSRCGGSRCRHSLVELVRGPREQLDEVGVVEAVAHREVGLRRSLRVLVPRTDELAIVAAVDAIADQRAQVLGNAARRVRSSGTRCSGARRARTARRSRRSGRRRCKRVQVPQCARTSPRRDGQRQVGVDLAEEKQRAGLAREQQRVLAAPAEAGLRRERDFEHRRAVGEHAIAEGRRRLLAMRVGELLQAFAQHLVVVAAERIARDDRPLSGSASTVLARSRARAAGSSSRARDHAHRAGHQLRGARAARAVACHIIHLAVPARRRATPARRASSARRGRCRRCRFPRSRVRGPRRGCRRQARRSRGTRAHVPLPT